jgi:hypothetical protein
MPDLPGFYGATAFELTSVLIVFFVICFVYEIALVVPEWCKLKSEH